MFDDKGDTTRLRITDNPGGHRTSLWPGVESPVAYGSHSTRGRRPADIAVRTCDDRHVRPSRASKDRAERHDGENGTQARAVSRGRAKWTKWMN